MQFYVVVSRRRSFAEPIILLDVLFVSGPFGFMPGSLHAMQIMVMFSRAVRVEFIVPAAHPHHACLLQMPRIVVGAHRIFLNIMLPCVRSRRSSAVVCIMMTLEFNGGDYKLSILRRPE